jgi:hypothetical protein
MRAMIPQGCRDTRISRMRFRTIDVVIIARTRVVRARPMRRNRTRWTSDARLVLKRVVLIALIGRQRPATRRSGMKRGIVAILRGICRRPSNSRENRHWDKTEDKKERWKERERER